MSGKVKNAFRNQSLYEHFKFCSIRVLVIHIYIHTHYMLYFEMRETNADSLSNPCKCECLSTPDSVHKPQDPLQFISLTAFRTALATKLSC